MQGMAKLLRPNIHYFGLRTSAVSVYSTAGVGDKFKFTATLPKYVCQDHLRDRMCVEGVRGAPELCALGLQFSTSGKP